MVEREPQSSWSGVQVPLGALIGKTYSGSIMENKNIFVVTAIKLNHVRRTLREKKYQAWFKTFEAAKNYVLNNLDDMFEGGRFEHAVIEMIESGGLLNAIDEVWHEALYSYYDWDLYKVQICAKPKALKGIHGFAMIKR